MSKSITIKKQDGTSTKKFKKDGKTYTIDAKIRWDDNCGNGHNSFAITGTIWKGKRRFDYDVETCGCIHEEISEHFPEMRKYLKWHGCTSEGPLHYIENTTFLAGGLDCHGLKEGEFRQHLSIGGSQADGVLGVPNWEISFPEGFKRDVYSNEMPPPITLHWRPSGRTGKRKERELNHARHAAVWPEATNEQLSLPKEELTKLLEARLPALMEEFEKDIKELGFVW